MYFLDPTQKDIQALAENATFDLQPVGVIQLMVQNSL